MNSEFVEFLNKKKEKLIKDKDEKEKKKNLVDPFGNNDGKLKDLLSQLKGKEFGEVDKDMIKKKSNINVEENLFEVKLKEDKLLQNPFSNKNNKISKEFNYKENRKSKIQNKHSEKDNDLDNIVKSQLNKSSGKNLEETPAHPNIVYKVARFDNDISKQELETFFTKILAKNLIKVKRLKDDKKQYTGIVLIEVKNTQEVEKILFDKKYNHNNNRLKIKKYAA